MKKSIFFSSLILAAIIFFAIGYFSGIVHPPTNQLKEKIKREIISELTPETVYNLVEATVKEVGENYLIVIPSSKQNILGLLFPKEVKIIINEKTVIQEMLSSKDSENLFDVRSATLKNIKDSDLIHMASSDTNIKGTKEFTVTYIVFGSQK